VEFFTEDLKIPVERLWVSIYEDDDEAFEIWNKKVGLPPERIVRMGKDNNFWEHGTGRAVPVRKFILTGARTRAAANPIARWVATATVLLRFGIWCLRSLTRKRTAVIPGLKSEH